MFFRIQASISGGKLISDRALAVAVVNWYNMRARSE
jgi:hypothetical protein